MAEKRMFSKEISSYIKDLLIKLEKQKTTFLDFNEDFVLGIDNAICEIKKLAVAYGVNYRIETNIKLRQRIMKESSLPYSFCYKIIQAFWGKRCPICGAVMSNSVYRDGDLVIGTRNRIPTIQHNMPISKGGKHELGNISVICRSCNVSLRDTPTNNLNSDEVIRVWRNINGRC